MSSTVREKYAKQPTSGQSDFKSCKRDYCITETVTLHLSRCVDTRVGGFIIYCLIVLSENCIKLPLQVLESRVLQTVFLFFICHN